MAEEAFFSRFVDKLRESVSSLAPPKPNSYWARSLYLSAWNSFDGSAEANSAIVACDGSLGRSSFSGGLIAWTARAIAHIYSKDKPLVTVPDVAVELGYSLKGEPLFMKALELQVLRKGIEKALTEHRHVFALFDGSLYLTFLHYPPKIEAMASVFERYVAGLTSLLKLCRDSSNVVILGISKDSDISYLRARILLDALSKVDPSVGSELAMRGRSVRRMADGLRKKVEGLPADAVLRGYLDELQWDISDEALYSDIAPEPGFTTPLLLAPQTIFITEEARRGTRSWWESAFRKRLENSKGLSRCAKALDEYYAQPPIALIYWKPRHAPKVYRLDIPSSTLGHEGRCGDLPEDRFGDERSIEMIKNLIAVLNWLSLEPFVANPLMEVDAIARLDRRLYKQAYEPMIVEELRKRGFRADPRSRSIRDFVLRGY